MNLKNQHIKNFFRFLEKKENRKTKFVIKYRIMPEDISEKEMDVFKHHISPEKRAGLFNGIFKKIWYSYVLPFDIVAPSLALATQLDKFLLINQYGEPNVTGVDLKKLRQNVINDKIPIGYLEGYLNSVQEIFLYYNLDRKSLSFLPENLFLITVSLSLNLMIIVNENGMPTTSGVTKKIKKQIEDIQPDAYENTINVMIRFKMI